MSRRSKPFGACALCGFLCATQAEFLRHIDNHDGNVRPDSWYQPVRTRRTYAQWDDNTAVMVHVNPETGDIRYPGRHDAKLKSGYERQYLRSLREVEQFERSHAVRSEMAWYDKGTGRGFDDYIGNEKVTH